MTKQLEKQPRTSIEILPPIGSNPGAFFLLVGSAFLLIGIIGFFVIRRKAQ